ncbi:hypothetical protein [Namhaeicola litoreus]|uniref:Lipoprotein n=1 Tax=Namhaeicola litoreus TaxID=1052145 RepID=A0ABW3Y195_9FLAO
MKVYLTILMAIMLTTCDNNKEEKIDCTDTICTMDFRTIAVSLKDNNGNPISLDKFKVTSLDNQKDITRDLDNFNLEEARKSGAYPVFGDELREKYQSKEVEVLFEGYIENKKVANLTFLVGADCCHVFLIEGQLEVVLNI